MSSASALDGHNRPPASLRTPGRAPANPKAAVEDSRDWQDPRASEQARRASEARQASGRRRHVDPATCERDYSAEEREFMQAMNAYKQSSGRMFPTWSEVLEVLLALGYAKQADPTDPSLVCPPAPTAEPDGPRPKPRLASC